MKVTVFLTLFVPMHCELSSWKALTFIFDKKHDLKTFLMVNSPN